MDLFDDAPPASKTGGTLAPNTPLAARMRPRSLDEFVGQSQIVGEDTLLRRAIEEDALTSVLFYGPPGVGKSTLANVIAKSTKANFEDFSAVTGGVPELKLSVPSTPTATVLVLATRPRSAGVSFAKHFSILCELPAAEAGYSNIADRYVARYGRPPVGTRIFIRTRQVLNGWKDDALQTSAIVSAS